MKRDSRTRLRLFLMNSRSAAFICRPCWWPALWVCSLCSHVLRLRLVNPLRGFCIPPLKCERAARWDGPWLLVEAAGIEPASASPPPQDLHA